MAIYKNINDTPELFANVSDSGSIITDGFFEKELYSEGDHYASYRSWIFGRITYAIIAVTLTSDVTINQGNTVALCEVRYTDFSPRDEFYAHRPLNIGIKYVYQSAYYKNPALSNVIGFGRLLNENETLSTPSIVLENAEPRVYSKDGRMYNIKDIGYGIKNISENSITVPSGSHIIISNMFFNSIGEEDPVHNN